MQDNEKYWFNRGVTDGKKLDQHPEQIIQEAWMEECEYGTESPKNFSNFLFDFIAWADGVRKGSTYYKTH